MPISRGQMPRQLYGLGSLVKSIGKAVKGAVKGVTKAVKSPLGIAALGYALGGGFSPAGFKFGTLGSKLGLGSLTGGEGNVFSGGPFSGIANFVRDKITSGDKLSQMLKVGSVGGLLTGLLAKAEQGDEGAQSLTRNIPALKKYLFENYKNLGYTDQQAQELTDKDTSEYTGMAEGGRIGYAEGTDDYDKEFMRLVGEFMERGFSQQEAIDAARDELERLRSKFMATGGRVQYAMGSPEENAIQASGIMGLPLNQNPAGVTELDLRETGGFIPPVGVKEKADDIPAMLSNNEFVFTADAVRGMGDGNVNVGAQRMYDMMKKLENGGRV